jgi:hypothetical protein
MCDAFKHLVFNRRIMQSGCPATFQQVCAQVFAIVVDEGLTGFRVP